ncbi:integrase core domain-containing protein, partial [Mycoplasma leonicaptivi]
FKKKSKIIVHSDHGYQYSSNRYIKLSKKNNFKISMGRVGNSLDNREAEYFFSNIKSEMLNKINISKLNFSELLNLIKNYVDWYNFERIQSNLQWKTPQEVWDVNKY